MSTKNIIPKYDMFEASLSTSNWEIKYQQLLAECLNTQNNFELILKINMYLYHFMGEFIKYSKNIVSEIINDLYENTKKFNLSIFRNADHIKLEHYFAYEDEKNKTTIKIAWNSCQKKLLNIAGDEEIIYSEEQIKLLGKGFSYIYL